MTNNEFIKQFYPDYVSPKCAECGCDVNLSMKQIYTLCLVNHTKFLRGEFEGLCPECTQKWKDKKDSSMRGYNAKVMVVDELKEYL